MINLNPKQLRDLYKICREKNIDPTVYEQTSYEKVGLLIFKIAQIGIVPNAKIPNPEDFR